MENLSIDEKGTAAKGPDSSQSLSAGKAQLRLRVEARMEELEKTVTGLEAVGDRCRSLTASLQLARSYLRDGWDGMSEAETAKLSYWLERTEDLIVTSPGMPAIQQA